MLFCMALIFPGGLGSANYVNVLIGIVFFVVGVQILAGLAKYDPLFSQIFSRAIWIAEHEGASFWAQVLTEITEE